MATIQELHDALIKADASGNVDDAKALADEIRRMQSASSTPSPSMLSGLGTAFSQGLTLGTEDEIRAAAKAAIGGSYGDEMQRLSAERSAFSRQHPWLSGGATALGSVVPMAASLFAAPETMGGSTAAAGTRTAALLRDIMAAKSVPEVAAKGAIMGGLSGAASAEPGKRETGAILGTRSEEHTSELQSH